MAKKTFKIGEYARGGVISVETTKSKVTIINREWDFSKGSTRGSSQSNSPEIDRVTVNVTNPDARNILMDYLNNLTTSYYADKIMEWIEKSVTFHQYRGW